MSGKPSPETIEALFRREAGDLLRFLQSRLGDPDRAADLAQETWVRVLRARLPARLDNPRGFLLRTATNLAIDAARREKLERDYLRQEAAGGGADDRPSVERRLEAERRLRAIDAALGELPDATRQAFTMHRQRNMSYPEIAAALGVSVSMVEKHIIEALRHLRHRVP